MVRASFLLAAASLVPTLLVAQRVAGADSAWLGRAQQLAAGGNSAGGRAVVDSVLLARRPGTIEYAEALYWRAMLAANAVDAERDYLALSVEYPLSPRAADALLRIAQLESARGDRAAAQRHLARLAREHPTEAVDPRAGLWAARLLLELNDLPTACAILGQARRGVPASDVELANQLDYQAQRCAGVEAPPAIRSPAEEKRDQAAAAPRDSAPPPSLASGSGSGFSTQIAAFRSRAEADATVRRLTKRGYPARVVGDHAPFRVRVGHYATRAGALEMQKTLRRTTIDAIVVEDEPGARPRSSGAVGDSTPRRAKAKPKSKKKR